MGVANAFVGGTGRQFHPAETSALETLLRRDKTPGKQVSPLASPPSSIFHILSSVPLSGTLPMSHPPFITQLEASLDFCTPGSLSPATRFRELPEWDSLANLIALATFDEVFGKQISADDLNACQTLADIMELAK